MMTGIKKPIFLAELVRFTIIDKVIIESLEQALYRLLIQVDGQQYYVLEKKGKSLTRRSIVELQELLIPFPIRAMYLSHKSPYDEMIGQEVNQHGNEMLVTIGDYFKNTRDVTLH